MAGREEGPRAGPARQAHGRAGGRGAPPCSQALDAGGFAPFLLHGVTGSGKTEVYLRWWSARSSMGKGALVLVPEIALTPQLVGRFRSRFGAKVAVLHSALKDRERLRALAAAAPRRGAHRGGRALGHLRAGAGPRRGGGRRGARPVVQAGGEAALPGARPGGGARASRRARWWCSAAPRPRWRRWRTRAAGRYRRWRARPARRRPARCPRSSLVDLRVERPRPTEQPRHRAAHPLAQPAHGASARRSTRGSRSSSSSTAAGTPPSCSARCAGRRSSARTATCASPTTWRARAACATTAARSTRCPSAARSARGPLLSWAWAPSGWRRRWRAAFPDARVARLDRDAATSTEKLTELLAAFARREIDVLVGTQMVAKGHDFPGVTLVCVVMADTALALPDFRAAERTFHLLTQVAGRAGRGADPGRVLVQTYNPRRAAGGAGAGARLRRLRRDRAGAAPRARLAALLARGRGAGGGPQTPALTADAATPARSTRWPRALPPPSHGVRLLGPAPAPIARIKGKTRWQLVVKGPNHAALLRPARRGRGAAGGAASLGEGGDRRRPRRDALTAIETARA